MSAIGETGNRVSDSKNTDPKSDGFDPTTDYTKFKINSNLQSDLILLKSDMIFGKVSGTFSDRIGSPPTNDCC